MAELRSFRNDPDDFLTEALTGAVAAHPDAVWRSDPGFVARREPAESGRVALVSGGGSGHEPLHLGFLGAGMLDAVCPGLLFTSPNALQVAGATRAVDAGAGVLHIVKNYTGDVMNFQVARQLVADEGVATGVVLVDDDVATDAEDGPGRRGTAATVVVEKVCGAAAARGDDLASVAELGRRVAAASRSMAVALHAGLRPDTGEPTFDLPGDQMEVGVGIHGERGTDRVAAEPADRVVERLLDGVVPALGLGEGDRVICVVNGLGATHLLELNLIFGIAARRLAERGVAVVRSMVGSYVTALSMSGVSITLTRVEDELLELFDAPTAAPAWPNAVADRRLTAVEAARIDSRVEFAAGAPNAWLHGFVTHVLGRVDALTELDRRAGDGDFGDNMRAALKPVPTPVSGGNAEALRGLSQCFLVYAGGTSGAVFGVLLGKLATALEAGDTGDALAAGLAEAAAAVRELGGAEVGDATLVDALVPAAEAARVAAAAGADFAGVLAEAGRAAAEGARSTAAMTARKGRASYTKAASEGVIDPGAVVLAWLFGGQVDAG